MKIALCYIIAVLGLVGIVYGEDTQKPTVKGIDQQRTESTGLQLPQGSSMAVQRYQSTHPTQRNNSSINGQKAKSVEQPSHTDGQGNWIPPGGKIVTEDTKGWVVSRTYDVSGKLISTIETTIGAKTTMPSQGETDASIAYIKYGARNDKKSNLNTNEVGWNANVSSNNYNCSEFWLRSDVIDAYCSGVMESAYRKYGMEYPKPVKK